MSNNSSGLGTLIGIALVVGAIILVVYIAILLAGAIAAVAGAGGLLWGGGTALINYGKSFKENIIDSNRAPA
ncbi:MAG: hypothetical protein E7459_06060 [Ruminococcaceae bacterium]|nr:hypothetical protein [Oscillospiraceae bacterium]